MEFDLPMPPSVNSLYTNVSGIGRVKTKLYRKWITEASWMLVTQRNQRGRHKRVEGRVSVTVKAMRPQRVRDLDNILKAIMDLLKSTQTIRDDSQVVEIKARWVDEGVPCSVLICAAEEETAA